MTVQALSYKASREKRNAIPTRKRDVLFPTGVKLCAQDTLQQAIANHLNYFHLRVCQETVWEAFKIFWDRLPEHDEYQHWTGMCQDGSVTIFDIGTNFSRSQEHLSLMRKNAIGSIIKAHQKANSKETQGPLKKIRNEIDVDTFNRPLQPHGEQLVELSIQLKGVPYNDALKDPSSLLYQRLTQQFTEKIEDAFERLPGFRNVIVLEFRRSVVIVHYAITLDVGSGSISNDTIDYINLQSNMVENLYPEPVEQPIIIYTIMDLRNYITEALHKENLIGNTSLDVDPDSLQLENVETLLSGASRPTSGPVYPNNLLDIILAAERPPDVPGQELNSNDVFVSGFNKNDFLLDAGNLHDVRVGSQDVETDPNDVIVLEDSPTLPPLDVFDNQFDMNLESVAKPDITPAPGFDGERIHEVTADMGSGSDTSRSEKDSDVWSWLSMATSVKPGDSRDPDLKDSYLLDVKQISTQAPEILNSKTPFLEEHFDSTFKTVVVIEEEDSKKEFTLEQPFLDGALETPDLRTHPPSTTTDQAPVFWTMETLTVELSMQTIEASGMYEDFYTGEPTIKNMSATDYPLLSDVITTKDYALETLPNADGSISNTSAAEDLVTKDLASEASVEVLDGEEVLMVKTESDPITNGLITVSSTALSPEKESPFTRIYDVVPDDYPFEKSTHLLPFTVPHLPDDETEVATLPIRSQDDATLLKIKTHGQDLPNITDSDLSFHMIDYGGSNVEEDGREYPSGAAHGTDTESAVTQTNPGQALMVFFSLRVTNMMFTEDLFNKSSPEFKALEQRFLELLVPYLQSNLTNFQNLEILNFRNGSIVVNSRMKFDKPVPQGVSYAVYLILEDFCNTAYQTMNLAIDKYSLDVESGDQADPCKFQACNDFSNCMVNRWSGEAECVCDTGYFSVDGLPCQSICDLQQDFCLNDGKCDVIPGQGAICRCRVGENWWYRGEHCEEYMSEPVVVGVAIASVAGLLLVALAVILFLSRVMRDQRDKDEMEDPLRRRESLPSLEQATKYNPMFESDITVGYSHYCHRYPEPVCSTGSAEASTDFSTEEIRHIYENSELTKEEIQDRLRILELYAKNRQFADFVRQH
ncbi:interphotoreceptor matrix proteoglycan 2-like, partial [Scleropages formosus]